MVYNHYSSELQQVRREEAGKIPFSQMILEPQVKTSNIQNTGSYLHILSVDVGKQYMYSLPHPYINMGAFLTYFNSAAVCPDHSNLVITLKLYI